MFISILIIFSLICSSSSEDILDILMPKELVYSRRAFYEKSNQAKHMSTLIRRLSELPLTTSLKADAWYRLLAGQEITSWNASDFSIFRPIIPFLPLDLLANVDFNDEEVLSIFGSVELEQVQVSMVAELLLNKLGNDIFTNHEAILKMGNLFCGLPDYVLDALNEDIIRSLLAKKFFKIINTCSTDKLSILLKKVRSFRILGPLRTWTPSSISFAGSLIAGLDGDDIRKIRARSFLEIDPAVIEMMPLSTLMKMRRQQLKQLKRPSLLAWRRATKDVKSLYSGKDSTNPLTLTVVVSLIIVGQVLL